MRDYLQGKRCMVWSFMGNTHEAIIPMEVYQAVQDEKARRRELGVFANWSIQTTCFTSKIKCPHCGCSYVHNKRTKRRHLPDSTFRVGK